jgi:hypothetical protein
MSLMRFDQLDVRSSFNVNAHPTDPTTSLTIRINLVVDAGPGSLYDEGIRIQVMRLDRLDERCQQM